MNYERIVFFGGFIFGVMFGYLLFALVVDHKFMNIQLSCESQNYTYEKGMCFDVNTKLELKFIKN